MNRPNMPGSVPNVRKAKALHETRQAERATKVSKLKSRAAMIRRPR
jgi:hypothetical protein